MAAPGIAEQPEPIVLLLIGHCRKASEDMPVRGLTGQLKLADQFPALGQGARESCSMTRKIRGLHRDQAALFKLDGDGCRPSAQVMGRDNDGCEWHRYNPEKAIKCCLTKRRLSAKRSFLAGKNNFGKRPRAYWLKSREQLFDKPSQA
jgi:hypothetical protein